MWDDFMNNQERIPEGIAILKTLDNLYLYGDGKYAKNVYMHLRMWKIEISGVIVSDSYKMNNEFCGKEIHTLSEIDNENMNVIAGYHILLHPELNKKLVTTNKIKNIYYLDGLSVFINKGTLCNDIILLDDYYKIYEKRKLNYQFYKDNYEKFQETFCTLEDELSQKTMECYIRGHIELKGWPMLPVWNESAIEQQYFPEDIIQLTNHEVFVDCGAFIGDTLESFCKRVKTFDKYYALEPDVTQFEQLDQEIKKVSGQGEVVYLPIGVSDKKQRTNFHYAPGGRGQVQFDNNRQENHFEDVDLDCIDHLIDDLEKVSFIKMDIEGAEIQALVGAQDIIKRCRPKLAICVYHKREDLITIPQFIKKLVPDYRIYMRAHRPYIGEVVLYAVCKEKSC